MSLDFQQVRQQVHEFGEKAPLRERERQMQREKARQLLRQNAQELDRLREKVLLVAREHDPNVRCALPVSEPLDGHYPAPPMPAQATLLAADGSQIAPDRHAEVEYCLINVGAIQMCHGSPEPPTTTIRSTLYYDETFYTASGAISDGTLALMRDFNERKILAELAEHAPRPVITFTDGPMELWGAKDTTGTGEFRKHQSEYKQVLTRLFELGVTTAGYVDKPAANLVVRLLEIALIPENDLPQIQKTEPLRGVTDRDLYGNMLQSGERSAVFAMQSKSAADYTGPLALHFFYLNVGRMGHPWLARVEIPAWVAENPALLDGLHASLVSQCRILGARPYPYLLHRAHEAAVVTQPEKAQVTEMIMLELRRRGVHVGEKSNKQVAKDQGGRTSFSR